MLARRSSLGLRSCRALLLEQKLVSFVDLLVEVLLIREQPVDLDYGLVNDHASDSAYKVGVLDGLLDHGVDGIAHKAAACLGGFALSEFGHVHLGELNVHELLLLLLLWALLHLRHWLAHHLSDTWHALSGLRHCGALSHGHTSSAVVLVIASLATSVVVLVPASSVTAPVLLVPPLLALVLATVLVVVRTVPHPLLIVLIVSCSVALIPVSALCYFLYHFVHVVDHVLSLLLIALLLFLLKLLLGKPEVHLQRLSAEYGALVVFLDSLLGALHVFE